VASECCRGVQLGPFALPSLRGDGFGPGVWALLGGGALLVSGGLGWWAGRSSLPVDGPTTAIEQLRSRRDGLEGRQRSGRATPMEQQQLLRLRLALGDRDGATDLLETLADREPDRPGLRLLLADLRAQANDRAGAERELRLVLNRHPQDVAALRDLTRLRLARGDGDQAEAEVRLALTARKGQPSSLPLALLLADLLQRRGKGADAEQVLRELNSSHPDDPRPLLALALLKQQQGAGEEARKLLVEARQVSPGLARPVLDRVATSWSLSDLRRAPATPGSGGDRADGR
jgi:Flp pilus assembly protein TadD